MSFAGDVRAISPVIGGVLLIAVLVGLASVGAYMILGLADTSDPAPGVKFELRESGDAAQYALVHESGDELDGDELELRGAVDPDSPAGRVISAGGELRFYPTTDTIRLVWYGDDGTSYVLTTVSVEQTVPEADEGCEWVANETDEQVTVRNDGVVVGETVSNAKEFDGDDATVYGDVDVEKVVNLQDGSITGDTTSRTEDVKVQNGSLGGSVDAEKVAEATDGTVVEGDVVSQTKDAKILDSSVEGSITADGIVKLDNATVEGDVYVDPSGFDCTDSTIDGEDCGSYTPKDPVDW